MLNTQQVFSARNLENFYWRENPRLPLWTCVHQSNLPKLKISEVRAFRLGKARLLEYSCSGSCKSSRLHMFFKMGVLKNFTIFTEKHLCWSLFLIRLQAWRPATLSKRGSDTGVSCEYHKIFEESFLYRTSLMAASGFLTKLAENNCEENHFSVDFFS